MRPPSRRVERDGLAARKKRTKAIATAPNSGSAPADDAERPDFEAGIEWSTDDEDRLVVSSIEDQKRHWPAPGIREGDVIVSVDGRRVSDRNGLLSSLRRATPGEPLAVVIERDGRSRAPSNWISAKGERPVVSIAKPVVASASTPG